jgi:hypothetical protein
MQNSQQLPGPNNGLVGLRNIQPFQANALSFLSDMAAYGDMAHFRLGPISAHFVNTPHLLHQIMVEEPEKYEKSKVNKRLVHNSAGMIYLASINRLLNYRAPRLNFQIRSQGSGQMTSCNLMNRSNKPGLYRQRYHWRSSRQSPCRIRDLCHRIVSFQYVLLLLKLCTQNIKDAMRHLAGICLRQ